MKRAPDHLREGGYRLTPQRLILLRVLEETQEHLDRDQIRRRVLTCNPRVSNATISRTLQSLQDPGLVRVTRLLGKHLGYEVVMGTAYHHFVCRN